MGKFDLQPSQSRRVEVSKPQTTVEGTVTRLPARRDKDMGTISLSPKMQDGILEIARKVFDTRNKVAIIHAETEQQVALIAAEIQKIVATTDAEIKKLKAAGSEWRANFAEKQKIVDNCLMQLNAHPEWSDEVKTSIIALATKALEGN